MINLFKREVSVGPLTRLNIMNNKEVLKTEISNFDRGERKFTKVSKKFSINWECQLIYLV